MSFQLKLFLKQTNIRTAVFIIVTVIVACLIGLATSQRRTTTGTKRTSWAEDPVFVQGMVSRMMYKHPLKNEKEEEGLYGFSIQPNMPGYQPYWYGKDERDKEWEEKCRRCPSLFQRYKTVCAVDSTGDVMVNASMCKILQMNCLNGFARGHVNGTYRQFDDFYITFDNWARWTIRLQLNMIIQLSSNEGLGYPKYEFRVDGWRGYWSQMQRNDEHISYKFAYYNLHALWAPPEYSEFVVNWNMTNGWLLMTRPHYSDYREGFYFNYTDEKPFPIRYIAIGSTEGYTGDYIIKDLPTGFVVTQMSPCRSHILGQGRPLVTSPTDVPVILSKHTPANKGFFSRIKHANLDLANVSFLTREEY